VVVKALCLFMVFFCGVALLGLAIRRRRGR
jgi:hypothetical protein